MDAKKFWEAAKSIKSDDDFNSLAVELFQYQSRVVQVYHRFLDLIHVDPSSVTKIEQIPFLPVQLFKSHAVTDQETLPGFYFTSSGTAGQVVSRHYIADLKIYDESLSQGFRLFYGDPSQYCFLALLPSYLERKGSSLVYMANELIRQSNHPQSGFYLHNHEELAGQINILKEHNTPVFLLGVTYALLDLFGKYPMQLPDAVIMETGGMKGKRKEMIRAELHEQLSAGSGAARIHSEYGMTEMLSQAYSESNGIFRCPPWMKVKICDLHDPFQQLQPGETGVISVIDLANIHSCAFIATQDLGRLAYQGGFEVLGRMDSSELRGCNLMIG